LNIDTLETVLLILLIVDAVALAVLVLLQQGKGADIGAAFGSGSANTLFGAQGTTSFITKATAWLAIGFFFIAFGLAYAAREKANTIRGIGMPDSQVEDRSLEPGRDFPTGGESEESQEYADPGDEFPSLAPQSTDAESDVPDPL
jgi:preprotein translocase subunit SecG|tara:strand:- start:11097 stop:11531 length:435 start_codon:yes stop_codon:yes gene_type:complete